MAGFSNFQVISYHLVTRSVVPAAQIAVLYAVAMGVDAVAALVVGKAHDKVGLRSLVIIPFATLPLPFLAFSHSYPLAIVSAALLIFSRLRRAAAAQA